MAGCPYTELELFADRAPRGSGGQLSTNTLNTVGLHSPVELAVVPWNRFIVKIEEKKKQLLLQYGAVRSDESSNRVFSIQEAALL